MGDAKRFEDLVPEIDNSLQYLAGYVSRRCKMEYEDALQELMIAAWRSSETFDENRSTFNTYASRRMSNRAKTLIHLTNRKHIQHSGDSGDNVIYYDFTSIHTPTGDIEIPDHRAIPEDIVLMKEEQGSESDRQQSRLDMIENLLTLMRDCSDNIVDEHALTIFKRLRVAKRRRDGLLVARTLSEVAAEMELSLQRVSSIYNQKIKILGDSEIRDSIYRKIQEGTMAVTKGKKPAAKKAAPKVERKPRTNGLQAKIEWLEAQAVAKGKSRSQAIEMLLTKYPEMSENYARTIVYSQMKDYDWTKSERKTAAPKAPKAKAATKAKPAATKKSVKKSAPAPAEAEDAYEEDEEIEEDDFDFEDDEF